jgi:hypothetical protein
MAARSVTTTFLDVVREFYQARETLASQNLNPEAMGRAQAVLVGRLRSEAEARDDVLARHEANARTAAMAASPAARRRAAIHEDPIKVHSLRELLKAAPDAEVVEFAKLAVEKRDYAVAAALVGVTVADEADALVVQQAVSMKAPEHERALAELVVVRSERARIVQALEFAAPGANPRGLEAANDARTFELDGHKFDLDQPAVRAAYEAAGVEIQIAMPAPPEPREAAAA